MEGGVIRIALIGESGGGKSKLLSFCFDEDSLKEYEAEEGEISAEYGKKGTTKNYIKYELIKKNCR